MSEETVNAEVQPKTELSMSQRVAANEILADDINKAGNGLRAETWVVTSPNPGTGVSVFDGDEKFAVLTVNGSGYIKLRSFLKTAKPSTVGKLADFGAIADEHTQKVAEYKGAGGTKFNLARLSK